MEAKITEDANTQVLVSYFNPLDQLVKIIRYTSQITAHKTNSYVWYIF